jgi:PRTRC genetic system protein B
VDDQYLFRWRENGAELIKFISPAAVRAAFSQEPIDTGWLPLDTRRWGTGPGGDWAVLFAPPARRRLWFENDGLFAGKAARVELEVPMPGLVVMGLGQTVYVWAVKEKALHPDRMTYHAPLPNLDHAGAVCFGSNPLPRVTAGTIAQGWRLFLESPFTNHSTNGKSRRYPDDVRVQLARLAASRRRTYPTSDLVSRQQTVNQSVEGALRGAGTWR